MLEIIDATHYGNKARYLNHSCDSNCRARVVDIDGKKKIMIYTIRDIRKDEELTYDYQFKIESGNHIECKCGSKNCQGRLN
jgi:[histone H3]-lysine4 N-trimethyltransferase SETD1